MSELAIGFNTLAPVACEIINERLEIVRTLTVAGYQTLSVDPGNYLVRLRLPSGETLARGVTVAKDASSSIFFESSSSPHEWLETQHQLGNTSLELAHSKDGASFEIEPVLSGLPPVWLRLLSYRNGAWVRDTQVDMQLTNHDDQARLYRFQSSGIQRLHLLQIGGLTVPWRHIILPPDPNGTEMLVRPARIPTKRNGGVTVNVVSQNLRAETLLRYLTTGAVDPARVVAEGVLGDAEAMLQGKLRNPMAATVGGYYLLHHEAYERLHNWPNNFAEWIDWLPDASIIHAWQLLRAPAQSGQERLILARRRLIEAVQRGMPVYTMGVRLLIDGLELFAGEERTNSQQVSREVSEALARIRAVAGAMDWSESLTTFYGSAPTEPQIALRIGSIPDDSGLFYLPNQEEYRHAVTSAGQEQSADGEIYSTARLRSKLEDLVIRQMLGPWDGAEEIVEERSVRGRYLVGMLAPRGSSGIPEEYDDADPGGTDNQDGTTDAPASKAAAAMLPSSIGLTFAVAIDATALCVIARWGRYDRVEIRKAGYQRPDGSYRLVWQRTPIDAISPPIMLKPGKITPWSPYLETPEVTVQGIIRQRANQWIITLFLVNGQAEPMIRKDSAWLFQPELVVTAPDGAPIFERRALPQEQHDLDEQLMAMLYRKQVEFAVGHGVAVDAEVAHDAQGAPIFDRATRVWTAVVPTYELPQTTPPQASDPGYEQLADLTVDMQELATVPDGHFATHLAPLAAAYADWIARQEQRLTPPEPDLAPYMNAAQSALSGCRQALDRIRVGIALLDTNPQAAAAFRFANRAMALQRVHSLYSAAVRRDQSTTLGAFDTPENHAWRAFQLGFILLNLPGLTDPRHPDRATSLDDSAANPAGEIADLLWFPTGGGKTEAYLGLTAYTLAIRRLQGIVAGHSGHTGVAVLMRYTLRLLTLQQFQRAATLICACEVIRREDANRWGSEPFRIGLWVGQRSTPNSVTDADEAIKQLKKGGTASGGSPYQLKHCPWCGTVIDPGRDLTAELPEHGRARVLTYCGSLLSHCPFNARQSPGEGLPVMVVDEEIYHRLPALLIATVDKFAQMPWNGRTAMLFGRVSGYCERHGYLAPDVDHPVQSHPAHKGRGLPPARVLPVDPLRPPDLIIQDELHLISGPLGTLVGLYETAVDQLASWDVDGMRVRPKVIASTATIRRADQQVNSLFLRRVGIFPPQGLDAGDSFFAIQRSPSDAAPGRRYLGICASGIRHKTALIQSYVSFLAAAQQLYDQLKNLEPDPWMTLVGYFNSLRELAAMRRAADDAISTRLKKMDRRGLSRRFLNPWSVQELTSRLSAADIPDMLDRLETPFDPARKAMKGMKKAPAQDPIDVLLATNMISVGVDVGRLGLMVVGGQPKSTAEYIQATSRVGRRHPGLVATVYNWARPRDLSHYERFKHYHATFYQYVEALSVTPFSPRALDRGLSAVLVALARLGVPEYNPNHGAAKLLSTHPAVQAAVAQIVARAGYVENEPRAALVNDALKTRLDQWAAQIAQTVGVKLGYEERRDSSTVGLLQKPGRGEWSLFSCLNSLRDVEPSVNLVLDDGGLDGTTGHPWIFAERTPAKDAAEDEEDVHAAL